MSELLQFQRDLEADIDERIVGIEDMYVARIHGEQALRDFARSAGLAGIDEAAVMELAGQAYDRFILPLVNRWLDQDQPGPDRLVDPLLRGGIRLAAMFAVRSAYRAAKKRM